MNSDGADQSYAWGPDLSGTESGAGGIGGLAIASLVANDLNISASTYVPLYDGHGNVISLRNNSAQELAAYTYGPYGETTATGSRWATNPFRFSTKFTDAETGMVYYGYRYYMPGLGRWANRDPIEEGDAFNLAQFVGNKPASHVDALGLWTYPNNRRGGYPRQIIWADQGDTVQSAAQFVRLDFADAHKWLKNEDTGDFVGVGDEISECAEYSVPNTIFVDLGDVASLWPAWPSVQFYFNQYATFATFGFRANGFRVVRSNRATAGIIHSHLRSQDAYGWVMISHGVGGAVEPYDPPGATMSRSIRSQTATELLHHRLALVHLYGCEAMQDLGWLQLVSRYGYVYGSDVSFRPAFQNAMRYFFPSSSDWPSIDRDFIIWLDPP